VLTNPLKNGTINGSKGVMEAWPFREDGGTIPPSLVNIFKEE